MATAGDGLLARPAPRCRANGVPVEGQWRREEIGPQQGA